MELGEKLKELRNKKGKTQQEVCDEIGIAISSLRNYENGKIPETVQLKIIKNYYNVPYEYLLDDDCENKNEKNVIIGKELQLSDYSINNIKRIKEKDILNEFLGYYWSYDIIENTSLYYKINNILKYDFQLIISIKDIWEYIKDTNRNKKTEDLEEYFTKYDKSINNIIEFTENTIFFDASDSIYDLFKEEYYNIKDIIFNSKIEDNLLDYFFELFEEIRNKYIMYSKIIKLNITDSINRFLRQYEDKYNIGVGSPQYDEMLGKYIKYLNSDLKKRYKELSNWYKKPKTI